MFGETEVCQNSSSNPMNTGSGTSRMPKVSSTPRRISRARRTMSDAFAPPRLTRASVCLLETPASPIVNPFLKPARSMSHAADVLTVPVPAGYSGTGSAHRSASVHTPTPRESGS
jgi:hypothetical protein